MSGRHLGWRPGRRDVLWALALAGAGVAVGRLIQSRESAGTLVTRTRPSMGTIVEIRVPAGADGSIDEQAAEAAFAEFVRLERVFTPHKAGGGPVNANERRELEHVMALGDRVGRASDGALDLRIRDWIDLWGWETQPRRPATERVESVKRARAARAAVGTLREYAFGAVAKGYAVDRALDVLASRGVARALVNAGGEVGVVGDGWTVGVQHPRDRGALLDTIRLDAGQALATSGDYENYFVDDNRRWHHLLVPATGWPAASCRSVSVRAASCAEADVWSTALFVMGPKAAMAVLAANPALQALIVDADGGVTRSAGWDSLVVPGRL